MSSETPDTETPTKGTLANTTIRPPDPLRDAKGNPSRPGFREKPNKGSKAVSKKRKKSKKKK